jgi:integrase
LIVLLWRAGLRISEALALAESDLDGARGVVLVRHGLIDLEEAVAIRNHFCNVADRAGRERLHRLAPADQEEKSRGDTGVPMT